MNGVENKNFLEIPFEIKTEDIQENGIFTGYASTFGGKPDSHGDVIRRGAFSSTIIKGGRNGNGIPMLWMHNAEEPIGIWLEIVENDKGLKVVGQLALEVQKGKEAYELLKLGAIKGLSIGWDVPRDSDGNVLDGAIERDEKKRIRYLNKVDLWEISLVSFPSNRRAIITSVKDAIEKATNERELEKALRDECNLSSSASKYVVSLVKDTLFHREDVIKKEMDSFIKKMNENAVLEQLKKVKQNIKLKIE